MSNYINKYLNQSAFDADNTKQFPNTSLVGNNVVYNPTDPDDSNVTIDMTLPSAMEVTLFEIADNNEGTSIDPATYLDYIKVDGTSVNLATLYANDNALQMTSGNHIVKYKVKNPATTDINLFAIVNASNSYNNSMVFGEGFTTFSQGSAYLLSATNIVLPSTFQYISLLGSGEYYCAETPFSCTNLTLKYNGVVPLPYCEEPCSGYEVDGACYEDCIEWTCQGETDPETGDCLDEEICTAGGTEQSLITYLNINASNLYVPSAQVSAYNASHWSDWVEASAIQA